MTDLPPVTCSYCRAAYDRDEATSILTHPEPLCDAARLAQDIRRLALA
jgi:hypothetical protein